MNETNLSAKVIYKSSKNKTKTNNTQIPKKNFKKIQQTRRQRGYYWEDTLVRRFRALNDWKAVRLGSPSVHLPDIMAVNNNKSTIFTIEAKSGTADRLPVPFDQIQRCKSWLENFGLYKNRVVILAFKFLSKRRIGLGTYESRKLREFYKVWDSPAEDVNCVCTYNGETYGLVEGKRIKLELQDYPIPFKTSHIHSG